MHIFEIKRWMILNLNFGGLKSANINYDITAISKTRIMKNLEIPKNINLKNYNMEYTSTESTTA